MVMAYLRTCYSCKVRLNRGGPTYDLRWFRCRPKAKLFPHEHFGLSRYWFNYRKDFGEVPGTQEYSKGVNIHQKKGRCFRGKPEWFRDGVDLSTLTGQVVVDTCTSCPGIGPRIGLRVKTEFRTVTWVTGFYEPFLPWCMLYNTVSSSDPSLIFSTELVYNDDPATKAWVGGPTTPQVAWIEHYNDIDPPQLLEWLSFQGIALQFPPVPTNPVDWDYTIGDFLSSWPVGTVLHMGAALVVPHYYNRDSVKVSFGQQRRVSPARLAWFVSSTITVTPGGDTSPWSDGFSDGFGG